MEEHLADSLMATKEVLRWFGRYREANALVLLARLLRARNIDNLDALERFVTLAEEG